MTMDATSVPALIVGLFLVGPLVVVPLGLWLIPLPAAAGAGRPLRIARLAALPAGLALAAAFLLEPGPVPGLLAVPWLATASLAALVAVLGGIEAIRDHRFPQPGPQHAVWAALAFLAVAAGNALADRLGVQPFGFAPVIVLLTAVHFTFAGFVLVLVGTLTYTARLDRATAAAIGAVVVGIPVTAIGFFGVGPAALLGALLVAAGGFGIGVALLRRPRPGAGRSVAGTWLRRLAGASLMLSMPLAVAYAVGAFVGTTWLDLPTMARTHGALNVIGFALPAIVTLTAERIAATAPSGGPARPIDVLGFNLAPIVAAPSAGLVATLVALAPLPLPVRFALAMAGLGAIAVTLVAIATTWWVFAHSSPGRWDWVVVTAGTPDRWLNLTTGFDDSSATLHRSLGGEGRSIDVVDPTFQMDGPLRRARRGFPPPGPSVPPGALDSEIGRHRVDVVFLLMAAHEAHGPARLGLLRSAAQAIAPGGRLILVEHLRDAANILAFGPGAWHFSSRAEWLATTREAGWRAVDETRLSPFVAGFVLEPEAGR